GRPGGQGRGARAGRGHPRPGPAPVPGMPTPPSGGAPPARPLLCRVPATSTTATIGNPNLNAKFQMPVVATAVLIATSENPKLPNIRNVSPMATAPPAGTVFETAVDDWVSRNPCQNRRCGRTAWYGQTNETWLTMAAARIAAHQP